MTSTRDTRPWVTAVVRPGLDHRVVELGLAELGRGHAEVEHGRVEAAVLDGRDRRVAGDAEVGAGHDAEPVAADAVVVVRARLEDLVADLAARSLQDVPVAQHVRRPGVGVPHDAAEGARALGHARDADAGHDRVDAGAPRVRRGLGHHDVRRGVDALEHVGRHRGALDLDRRRDQRGAERLHLLRRHLGRDGELHAHDVGPAPVDDLVADADRGDVGVGEEVGAVPADVVAQRGRGRGGGHASDGTASRGRRNGVWDPPVAWWTTDPGVMP